MIEFNTKFVYCVWDEKLVGETVFVADSVSRLRAMAEEANADNLITVGMSNDLDAPFHSEQSPYRGNWVYCYFDPWYKLRCALEQGKTLEFIEYGYRWAPVSEIDEAWAPTYYRIAEESSRSFDMLDLVRIKDTGDTGVVVAVSKDNQKYNVGGTWHSTGELETVNEVEV